MSRHNHADQFGKSILRDALSLASTSETEVEVLAATQRIDVYAVPDPARAAERGQMGLLGWLSAAPSLFEPFSRTPSLARHRHCLRKQLTWHHELERRARAAAGPASEEPDADATSSVAFPWLVVISPGRPETALDGYACKPIQPGVYEAVAALRMRVIVLAELARTRETLLLRLLGAGRVLLEALADVFALPVDAWERNIVTPLLLHFGLASERAEAAAEESEMSAEIRAWYEEYQRKQAEAMQQARADEVARAVLTALRVRGIAVPEAARERILAEKDPERLQRWHERAIVASSASEVIDEPS